MRRQEELQTELEQCGEDMDKMATLLDEMEELNTNATDLDMTLLDRNIDKMMPELGFTPEDSDQLVAAYRSDLVFDCTYSMVCMFGQYTRCLLANTGSRSNMTVQQCISLGTDMCVALEAVSKIQQHDRVRSSDCISVPNKCACLYSEGTSH